MRFEEKADDTSACASKFHGLEVNMKDILCQISLDGSPFYANRFPADLVQRNTLSPTSFYSRTSSKLDVERKRRTENPLAKTEATFVFTLNIDN